MRGRRSERLIANRQSPIGNNSPVLSLTWTILAGVGAGSLGALLGLGGGIFLVPVLDHILGGDFHAARTMSLIAIIATSCFVSLASSGRRYLNIRLAMLLQVLTVVGATIGNYIHLSDRISRLVFALTAFVAAAAMIAKRDQRNVIFNPTTSAGWLDGELHDQDTQALAAYRVKRLPLGLAVAFIAGILSTLVGVGGGILVVPVLNSVCGVPIRVAAATSAFVLGGTAVPGIIGGYAAGHLAQPVLAAGAVLGVLGGSRAGFWIGARSGVRSLKLLMAAVLVVFGIRYIALVW